MKRQKNIYFLCILILVLLSCSMEEILINIDTNKIDRKILIIGIDGFRSDAMQDSISPFLYEFSLRSTTYYNDQHQVEPLTFSGPNWSSLLTGVHADKHQVTNNEFNDNNLLDFPHFFKYIKLAKNSINTESIVNWISINEHITLNYANYANTIRISDLEVYQQAKNALIDQTPIDPDILFVYFKDLDNAGHNFGFHPNISKYANTLVTIDGYVSDLVSIIETKRLDGEDWMIFVVSDHGGEGKRHMNGYDNDNIKNTIFYANHPNANFTHSYKSSMVDLAPTVLNFMGITSTEFNGKTDGISLID